MPSSIRSSLPGMRSGGSDHAAPMPCPVWCPYVSPQAASESRTARSTSPALGGPRARANEAAVLGPGLAADDGLGRVRPRAAEPRRRVREDEVAVPKLAAACDVAAGSRCLSGGGGDDRGNAAARFAVHLSLGEP